MQQIWGFVKEYATWFWAGFVGGGLPVTINIFSLPPMLGLVGFILRLSTAILFAAASGLATILVVDIYKQYMKKTLFKFLDKSKSKLTKLFTHGKRKKEKEEDEERVA